MVYIHDTLVNVTVPWSDGGTAHQHAKTKKRKHRNFFKWNRENIAVFGKAKAKRLLMNRLKSKNRTILQRKSEKITYFKHHSYALLKSNIFEISVNKL